MAKKDGDMYNAQEVIQSQYTVGQLDDAEPNRR
jgi:hypothetical protein